MNAEQPIERRYGRKLYRFVTKDIVTTDPKLAGWYVLVEDWSPSTPGGPSPSAGKEAKRFRLKDAAKELLKFLPLMKAGDLRELVKELEAERSR
jgi:hypothetical protein